VLCVCGVCCVCVWCVCCVCVLCVCVVCVLCVCVLCVVCVCVCVDRIATEQLAQLHDVAQTICKVSSP